MFLTMVGAKALVKEITSPAALAAPSFYEHAFTLPSAFLISDDKSMLKSLFISPGTSFSLKRFTIHFSTPSCTAVPTASIVCRCTNF